MTIENAFKDVFDRFQKRSIFNEKEISKIIGFDKIEEYKKDTEWSEDQKDRAANLTETILGLAGLFGGNYETVKKWLDVENESLKEFLGKDQPCKPRNILLNSPQGLYHIQEHTYEIRGLR